MEKRKRRRSDRAGRPAMRSPGRPRVAGRAEQQRFWKAIARGLSSEEAAVSCGVSSHVGGRWFREGGGMPPNQLGAAVGSFTCALRSGRRSQSYAPISLAADVQRRERLGGLLNFYHREAA